MVSRGDYECPVGMSVEDVYVVVNIKTLKRRLITHKFETGWFVGVERSLSHYRLVPPLVITTPLPHTVAT